MTTLVAQCSISVFPSFSSAPHKLYFVRHQKNPRTIRAYLSPITAGITKQWLIKGKNITIEQGTSPLVLSLQKLNRLSFNEQNRLWKQIARINNATKQPIVDIQHNKTGGVEVALTLNLVGL